MSPTNDRLFAAILTLALLLLPACTQQTQEPVPAPDKLAVEVAEEHWPNGQLRLRKEVLTRPDGTKVDHGTLTYWYGNGNKEYEAVYVEGRIQGVETQWHENGQMRTEQHYDNGLRNGPRYCWDNQGNKVKEENYRHDKPHGMWTIWRANGQIKWQQEFVDGLPKQ